MNDTSRRLVAAAESAVDADARPLAALAVAAVLREMSDMAAECEEDDTPWPDSGDLAILADDIDGSTLEIEAGNSIHHSYEDGETE